MTEPIISLEKSFNQMCFAKGLPPAGWQKEVFTLASLFSHGNLLHTAQSMPAHLSIATTPIGLSPSPLSSPSSTLCQQSTGMLTKTKNMLNSKRTSNNDCLKSFKMHESSVVCLCVCFGFFFKMCKKYSSTHMPNVGMSRQLSLLDCNNIWHAKQRLVATVCKKLFQKKEL